MPHQTDLDENSSHHWVRVCLVLFIPVLMIVVTERIYARATLLCAM